MLSFQAVEYDKKLFGSTLNIDISVKYNIKKKNADNENDGSTFDGVGSIKFPLTFDDKGDVCGSSYLNYFDNPEKWLIFPNFGVQIFVSENDI